ncbi:hypothetical protein EV183_000377 [Coemansia sp. RSA 2336]|nr:hypothetical protein EV183_000377 [Coemansia sp. RSA 2336]
MSDKEIEWESRKLGSMVGLCAIFIASVVGSKMLSLPRRANAVSAVGNVATGGVTGYMWHGFTRQAYQKKRIQAMKEASSKGIIPDNAGNNRQTPQTSPSDEYSLAVQSISSPFAAPASRAGASKSKAPADEAEPNARICRTLERTWGQCQWLQQRIETSFRLQVLPPFPERPSSKHTADSLYVERYRARIERWLNRLGSRKDVCESASMSHFASTKMTDKEVGSSAKQSISSLLLNLFGGSMAYSDRGFKVYVPVGDISEFDEDEEERRREYITSTEECAQELVVATKNLHTQEEAFGKSIVKAALAVSKAFKVDGLSTSPRNSESETNLRSASLDPSTQTVVYPSIDHERLDVSLALLQNSLQAYYWNTKELATWTEFNVLDVITEYNSMMGGVKQVMNHATQTLMLYEKALLQYQAHEQRANSLRVQYPSDTPSVKYANEQEAQSEREMELAHQEYTDANDVASRELVRFERERTHGICRALESMAAIELDAARARCQELRSLCRRIRGVQMIKDPPHSRTNIGPMLWQSHSGQSQYPPLLPTPGVSAPAQSPFAPSSRTGAASSPAYDQNPHSLSARISHKHTVSSGMANSGTAGNGSSNGDFEESAGSPNIASLRRTRTMENLDQTHAGDIGGKGKHVRNHSVFLEPECGRRLGYSPLSAPVRGSSDQPVASTSSGKGSSATTPLRHKKRWNGRISTLPFQGYDPEANQSSLAVDQTRLEEMAAEAEMEAELVRSGILTARKISRKKSAPNYATSNAIASAAQPPMLPAFRSQLRSHAAPSKLRSANSYTSLSTIPQPVSPSEYLQYSRQNLHSSLTRASSAGPSDLGKSTRSSTSAIPRTGRDIKGKGRAFAV